MSIPKQIIDDVATTDMTLPTMSIPAFVTSGNPPPVSGNLPIGWRLIVPVPLANANTGDPIAVVRLCPNSIFNAHKDLISSTKAWTMPFLFPVQFPTESFKEGSNFNIQCLNYPLIPYALVQSHRYVFGNVGVSVRVVSSTSSTGNLMFAQASNMLRNFDSWNYQTKEYTGFNTQGNRNMSAHAPKSYVLTDNSLARHVIVEPSNNPSINMYDHHHLMNQLTILSTKSDEAGYLAYITEMNKMAHLWPEDVLFIYPVGDLAGSTETLTLEFYFDFSTIDYSTYLSTRTLNRDYPFHSVLNAIDYYYAPGTPPPPPPPEEQEENSVVVDSSADN